MLFDLWHEFLNYHVITVRDDMDPGENISRGAVTIAKMPSSTDFQHETIQTCFAYVSKVRFEDGEIWEADLEQIAEEVQKVEADFNSSFFNEDNLLRWGSLLLP